MMTILLYMFDSLNKGWFYIEIRNLRKNIFVVVKMSNVLKTFQQMCAACKKIWRLPISAIDSMSNSDILFSLTWFINQSRMYYSSGKIVTCLKATFTNLSKMEFLVYFSLGVKLKKILSMMQTTFL